MINIALVGAVASASAVADEEAADLLLQQYGQLEYRLHNSQFRQPVVLNSKEEGSHVTGEIYAVMSYPFSVVSENLNNPDHWCDVLSLHINTKFCQAVTETGQSYLKIFVGKKSPQSLQDASMIVFNYNKVAMTPSYINIKLQASKGALGTSDIHIEFEAVPLQDDATFLHFTYSYSINLSTRIATQIYLATIGSNKRGFTITGTDSNGASILISGVRGIIERNSMRYYLAIDSFLSTEAVTGPQQFEQRLQSWFSATEAYPQQLHEMERAEYISMKHAESMQALP